MKFCGKCGNKLTGSEKFCAKCGNVLENKNLSKSIESENKNTTQENLKQSTNEVVNNKSNLKKKSNKKLYISLISIFSSLLIIIALLFGCKTYLNKKYSPDTVVEAFSSAIKNEDISELKKVIYSSDDDDDLISDHNLTLLIEYYSNYPDELKEVVKSLKKDCKNAEDLSEAGDSYLLDTDENYALTIQSKNLLFTKYNILINPIYIEISSNIPDAEVYIGNSKEPIATITDSKKVGPLLPIETEITLKAKSFNEDISETLYCLPYYESLIFFESYGSIEIESNYSDYSECFVYVNGENTNILVKDLTDNTFGPLRNGDYIFLGKTVNGEDYFSRGVTFYTYEEIATLNFYSYDLSKLENSSSTTSSTITSGKVEDYINKYKNKDYIIPTSNTTKLTFKDLNNYTIEELFLARNEIFARHGLVFESSPNIQKFFESKPWYKPDPDYTGDLSSDIEDHNAIMIKAIEFLKMAHTNNPTITSDYVLEHSNTKEYSEDEISKLNDWELLVAKNEIYARYGLEFSTKELLDHFKSKSWFTIDSSVGNDLVLNSIEQKNVALIVAEEQKRYYPRLNHDLGQ